MCFKTWTYNWPTVILFPVKTRVCRDVQRSNSNNYNSIIQVVNAVNKGYWPFLKSNTFSRSIPVVAQAWADWHLFGVNPFAERISKLSCGKAMVSAWKMGIHFETCYTFLVCLWYPIAHYFETQHAQNTQLVKGKKTNTTLASSSL